MDSQKTHQTGSEINDEPVYVLIGKLQRPHGLRGEIGLRILTDFPERIKKGRRVYVGSQHDNYKIDSARWHNQLMLVCFDGVNTKEMAQQLTNLEVFAAVNELPALPEGHYYHHQLLGLAVYEQDTLLGTLTEILETGANDVYVVVEPGGKELLLPVIPSVILQYDLHNKRIDVIVPEGLR